jgi:UDP-N-acetylglucosamine 4,6-dehydratase/5-epimerase
MELIKGTILVIGGTGTVGQELVFQLLLDYKPKEIIVFSRSEISQVLMREKFSNSKLRFIIGDVRDRDAINEACRGVDVIFHLAAIKHVTICETQPQEALKTNCMGATNVIKAAIRNNVRRVINMSTDKAVNPSNFYGHTKAIAERLFNNANKHNVTDFINIRSGNVLGSSGSVIPIMINQIKKNNTISITLPEMTRYFISLHQIARFLIDVAIHGEAGHTYIKSGRISFRLGDLAIVLMGKYGDSKTVIIEIGLRPGEKIHEEIYDQNETVYTLSEYGQTLMLGHISENSNDMVIDGKELYKWIDENGI